MKTLELMLSESKAVKHEIAFVEAMIAILSEGDFYLTWEDYDYASNYFSDSQEQGRDYFVMSKTFNGYFATGSTPTECLNNLQKRFEDGGNER